MTFLMPQNDAPEQNIKSVAHQTTEKTVWVPARFAALLNIIIGFLLLIVAPIAMVMPKSNFNGPVLAVNTVFALLIMTFGFFDYKSQVSHKRTLETRLPVIMMILGIVLFFLYSEFYSTQWIKTYHLYIIPINSYRSAFYMSYYAARDYLSTMSHTGGILLILLALYELVYVRYVWSENSGTQNK
jgi:hypothetical protein